MGRQQMFSLLQGGRRCFQIAQRQLYLQQGRVGDIPIQDESRLLFQLNRLASEVQSVVQPVPFQQDQRLIKKDHPHHKQLKTISHSPYLVGSLRNAQGFLKLSLVVQADYRKGQVQERLLHTLRLLCERSRLQGLLCGWHEITQESICNAL